MKLQGARGTKSRGLGLLVAGLALLCFSVIASQQVGPPSSGIEPRAHAAAVESASTRVVAFGHVDVEGGTVPLAVSIPGQVERILVEEGQTVASGQELLLLRDAEARAKRAEAQAALHQADVHRRQAQRSAADHAIARQLQEEAIGAAQVRLDAQERDIEHLTKLAESNVVPSEKLFAARDLAAQLRCSLIAEKLKLQQLRLHDPQETIELAEAAYKLALARVEQAEDYLSRHRLKAPADGIVLRIQLAEGQMTSASSGQPAIWFAPNKRRIVRCEVDQAFASRVRVGMAAQIHDDRLEGGTWTGVVDRCGDWIAHRRSLLDEPFQKNDVRTLECIIVLDPGQEELRIGQRMRIVFLERSAESASHHASR